MNEKYVELKREILDHKNKLEESRREKEILLNEKFENDKSVLKESHVLEMINELIDDGILKYSTDIPAKLSESLDFNGWASLEKLSIKCQFDEQKLANGIRLYSEFGIMVLGGEIYVEDGNIQSPYIINKAEADKAIVAAIKRPIIHELDN